MFFLCRPQSSRQEKETAAVQGAVPGPPAPVRTSPQKNSPLAPTKALASPVGSNSSSPRTSQPALTADPPALKLGTTAPAGKTVAAVAHVAAATTASPPKPNTPRVSPAAKPTNAVPVAKASG